jgi:hypothetical protein
MSTGMSTGMSGGLSKEFSQEFGQRSLDEARQEVIDRRRSAWAQHLSWFVGVNALTLGMNFMQENGHFTWALWMVLGWGIGMVSDTIATFFPDKRKLERAARKLLRKREEKYETKREKRLNKNNEQ